MRKAIIVFLLSLVVLLALSGCATLVTMIVSVNTNADTEDWPDEIKQFAKEEGLWPEPYKTRFAIPLLSDAISTYLLYKAGTYSGDYPIFGSDLNDFIAALFVLTSPLISPLANYMLYPPPPNAFITYDYVVNRYHSKKWLENPDLSPLIFDDYNIETPNDSFGVFRKVHITLTNISNKTIKSFKIRIYGYNSFGELVNLGIFPAYIEGVVQNIYFRPLKTETFTWDIYDKNATKIKISVKKVLFEDGTVWEAE